MPHSLLRALLASHSCKNLFSLSCSCLSVSFLNSCIQGSSLIFFWLFLCSFSFLPVLVLLGSWFGRGIWKRPFASKPTYIIIIICYGYHVITGFFFVTSKQMWFSMYTPRHHMIAAVVTLSKVICLQRFSPCDWFLSFWRERYWSRPSIQSVWGWSVFSLVLLLWWTVHKIGGMTGSLGFPGAPVSKLKVTTFLLLVFIATAKKHLVMVLFTLAQLHVRHQVTLAPQAGVLEQGKQLLVGDVLQHIEHYPISLAGKPNTAIGIGTSVVQSTKFCIGIQTIHVLTRMEWTWQDTLIDKIRIRLVSLFLGDFLHQLFNGIHLGDRWERHGRIRI